MDWKQLTALTAVCGFGYAIGMGHGLRMGIGLTATYLFIGAVSLTVSKAVNAVVS